MSGVASATLIVLVAVRRGQEDKLLAALHQLGEDERSPFARVPGTHFARFVFVPALKDPRGAALDAQGSYLLMCSDFDGSRAEWSTGLCERAGASLDAIMAHCEGFPGSSDSAGVAAFLADHSVPAGFTVASYRKARVEEVRNALRLREDLRGLAARAQSNGLEPGALRRAWSEVAGR